MSVSVSSKLAPGWPHRHDTTFETSLWLMLCSFCVLWHQSCTESCMASGNMALWAAAKHSTYSSLPLGRMEHAKTRLHTQENVIMWVKVVLLIFSHAASESSNWIFIVMVSLTFFIWGDPTALNSLKPHFKCISHYWCQQLRTAHIVYVTGTLLTKPRDMCASWQGQFGARSLSRCAAEMGVVLSFHAHAN